MTALRGARLAGFLVAGALTLAHKDRQRLRSFRRANRSA